MCRDAAALVDAPAVVAARPVVVAARRLAAAEVLAVVAAAGRGLLALLPELLPQPVTASAIARTTPVDSCSRLFVKDFTWLSFRVVMADDVGPADAEVLSRIRGLEDLGATGSRPASLRAPCFPSGSKG